MASEGRHDHKALTLQVSNVSVRLPIASDREYAVRNASFELRPREILCIVGESGSGKSVLAQTIMGLTHNTQLIPTGGSVLFEGEDLLRASTERLRQLRGSRMSMVFQEPMTALNPLQTIGFQIEEVLWTHTRMTREERRVRVRKVMRDVNLPDPEVLVHCYPHQISGGQRQRVMIAAALALEPRLLIADEPTTALDVTTQAQILSIIKQIQHSHETGVLFITHDIGVVAEIAHRVAVMRQGEIVEIGEVSQVLGSPRSSYTRMLISAVPSLDPKAESSPKKRPPVLAVNNLHKTYKSSTFFGRHREVAAVQGVTFNIGRGEVLGLVGESGSGKTTVARSIVRLVDRSEGTISVDGLDIGNASSRELRGSRRHMQIVFQDPYRSLNPRRTVGQSIIEGPVNFGLSLTQAWQRAADLLELVGIDPHATSRYPHQFSGGQRQRICIARALAMEPKLLIADEIVSALDVSVQAQVLRLLDDIRHRFDLAVLFVTHDLRVAAKVCDRIAVMYQGKIVEQGATARIFANPGHVYTRALLEAVPGKHWRFGQEAKCFGEQ